MPGKSKSHHYDLDALTVRGEYFADGPTVAVLPTIHEGNRFAENQTRQRLF